MASASPAGPGSAPFFTFDRTTLIITTILAALGVVAAVLALRRRKRQPCYAVLANNLLRNPTARVPGLDIRFSGIAVQSLTIARLAIWNAGREPILASDVAGSDPLAVVTPENVRILDAQVIQSTSPPSAMTLTLVERNVVQAAFEFINHRHGCVIEVIHTGTSADDLTLRGTIQDAEAIRRVSVADQVKRQSTVPKGRDLSLIVATIVSTLTASITLVIRGGVSPFSPTTTTRISLFILLVLSGIAGLRVLFHRIRSPLPKGFDKIAEGLFDRQHVQ